MERARYGVGLIEVDGRVIGINLGFNGCAEHEWGVQRIWTAFGIPAEGKPRFEAQKMTKIPDGLHAGTYGNDRYLIYSPAVDMVGWDIQDRPIVWRKSTPEKRQTRLENILESSLYLPEQADELLASAWDKHTFGLRARGNKYADIMEALETGFLINDVVFAYGSDLVSRVGLLLYSKIPERIKRNFGKKRS